MHGGVVQYDFGKATPSGFERTGFLNTPPTILLSAVAKLRADDFRGRSRLSKYASKLDSLPKFAREGAGPDVLFEADYNHVGGTTCEGCSKEGAVDRQPRSQEIVVHHGTIASGNQVMRDAAERNRVSSELGGVLCFEMEAAGLMNNFPCLVIRGICDYADSHKNKRWQPYAAGTAAAFAKEVLSVIPAAEVVKSRTADEIIRETQKDLVRREKEIKILNCLNASPYRDRKDRNPDRVPGTCDWFESHKYFQDWQKSKSSAMLWVSADPGCGKSVLAKYLVDSVLPTTRSRTVCYFFFKDDFEDQRNVVSALCCILHQLFKQKRILLSDAILDQFDIGGETFTSSFGELWHTLINAAEDENAGEII